MPKVWISWNDRYNEWLLWDNNPELGEDTYVVEVEMNASLKRQIRAAERQHEKFQNILEKFYAEGIEHPGSVRRVR